MHVSCICPTYGRAPRHIHLLEEAIESFLRQDYVWKEMIVMNDAPQELQISDYCKDERVRVINCAERYPTLGAKYNAAIEIAEGELLCPWEDDDISLPHRLSLSVDILGDSDSWNPHRHWYFHGNPPVLTSTHPMGVSHNASIFTRAIWEQVGGYPEISGPQDTKMDGLLRTNGHRRVHVLEPIEQWFYIYRWGVSPCHLSARRDTQTFYDEVGVRPVEPGPFLLQPHWRQDYEVLCREHIEALG